MVASTESEDERAGGSGHGCGLPPEGRRALREELDECRRAVPLEGTTDRFVDVVHTFTTRCSPADATLDQVRTVGMFMYALVFLNESSRSPDFIAAVHALLEGLGGRSSSRHPLGSLGLALARRLAQHAPVGEQAGFSSALAETLSACVWEVEHLEHWPRTLEQYEVLRHRTIGVQPFLELWKLMGQLPQLARLHCGPPLIHIECCSRRVQFLENDLRSVARDAERGQLNAVVMLARERNLPLPEAARQVREIARESAVDLASELAALRALRLGYERLDWYLGVVEGCTVGNLLAMADLAERYRSV